MQKKREEGDRESFALSPDGLSFFFLLCIAHGGRAFLTV